MAIVSWFAERSKTLYVWTRAFFGVVPGALKNHLNTEELARITVSALTAGSGFYGLLQAVMLHVGTIFPAPSDAALAAFLLTAILESQRRLSQGEELSTRPRRTRPPR